MRIRQLGRRVGLVGAFAAASAVTAGAPQTPAPAPTKVQVVMLAGGFLTAESFLEMSPDQQSAYAAGAVNGMLLARLFGAREEQVRWLEGCVEGMSAAQVAAMLEKQLRDHPERWHDRTWHVASFNVMRQACPSGGKPKN